MTKKTLKSDNGHFINSAGLEVRLVPISMLEMETVEQNLRKAYIERGEPIMPPTYEVEVAGGGKQTFPLTANNLVVEDNDAETVRRQLDWQKHINALNRLDMEINGIRTSIILEGIDCQIPEDGKWLARCKRLGIPVPDDPDEALALYKVSQVLKIPDDLLNIEMKIIELSSGRIISPERMDAAKAKFLGTIQQELEDREKQMDTA